ncbi:hypothetical protein I6B53_03090 [Schaalia sp. 19OD2882]|uniref:hypothetical protein n=1 Tax=Schaalia sp. 19OD2882 TaxID=2794089 RepID=UPI001C1E94B9|nr:hypothetical protein [Schaalia sp. 19OD2882]QWW20099.1 hypothetical protein I6B53_03090 [Schaalia sp. 19OD2882]
MRTSTWMRVSTGPRSDAQDPESGRVGLLILVCTMVVLALVSVGAVITTVHVQRSRLLTCADALAAAGAQVVVANGFYADGRITPGVGELDLVQARVQGLLDDSAGTTCRVGEGVHLDGMSVEDKDIVVRVSATARLVGLPPFLGAAVAPILVETSSARLG